MGPTAATDPAQKRTPDPFPGKGERDHPERAWPPLPWQGQSLFGTHCYSQDPFGIMEIERKEDHAAPKILSGRRLPVIVAEERTAGRHDLVRLESGGGGAVSCVRHTFDGAAYSVQVRLPVDNSPPGTKGLSGAYVFQDGIPLVPHN